MMVLSELIQHLKEMQQEAGEDHDPEVRLAIQPNWPFECHLQNIKLVHTEAKTINDLEATLEYEELTPEDREHLVAEVKSLRGTNPPIIYLAQGSQIGYATVDLWE